MVLVGSSLTCEGGALSNLIVLEAPDFNPPFEPSPFLYREAPLPTWWAAGKKSIAPETRPAYCSPLMCAVTQLLSVITEPM
jgi:hypothetical protein